jgi:propionyl-CoA synthetase
MRRLSSYAKAQDASLSTFQEFWAEQAKAITWDRPFRQALDDNNSPFLKWFVGGRLNMSYNCLDRHVLAGKGDNWAFIFDSPMRSRVTHYTYRQTLSEVKRIAGLLTYHAGVRPGDRVIIYMPLIPEAIFTMLACARIGAVHSVVLAGFAAKELASRIKDAEANVVFTADYVQEPNRILPLKPLVDQALVLVDFKGKVYVHERGPQALPCTMQQGRDFNMQEVLNNTRPDVAVTSVESSYPLYILYTSGTTGAPKGVLRDTGGYAVGLH